MNFFRKKLLFATDTPEGKIEASLKSGIKYPIQQQPFVYRPSSCPFCVCDAIWSTLMGVSPVEYFNSDFYFSVGTTVHLTIQKYLSESDFLLGNWHCPHCDKTWGPALSPQKCPSCGHRPIYEELTLYGPLGLQGHCDGLLWFPDESLILEIKTTSLANVDNIEDKPYHQKHWTQASLYVEMANIWFERTNTARRISDILFLYVPRDNPMKFRPIRKSYDKTALALNTASKASYDFAMSTGDFSDINRICASQEDAGDCQWKYLCFSANPRGEMLAKWQEYKNAETGERG